MLFGDVKTDKIGSFCVIGRSNIAIFFEHKNLLLFCQKEEDLPLLFHKMLEGLQMLLGFELDNQSMTVKITVNFFGGNEGLRWFANHQIAFHLDVVVVIDG